MPFEGKLKEVQISLAKEKMEGWLLFDFHHSNPLAHQFLEIPSEKMVTRRFCYWIPKEGNPIKIVSLLEPSTLDHLPGVKWFYKSWQEWERLLLALLPQNGLIAMEYSPYNALPAISRVDAGIVEFIRRAGVQIVSSANLLQRYTSQWSLEQLQTHFTAAKILESVVERTWALIERSLQRKAPIDEYQVQQFMRQAIADEGCQTAEDPICAVNAHSADPHYQAKPARAALIAPGDVILLDLWCKQNLSHAVYADITRVGVAAPRPTQKQQEIFDIVKEARDYTTRFIREHYERHHPLQGWQVDQACREFIQGAGYGDYFIHRTGHNIGEDVHGYGANLDNLETHDERELLPGTAFSVEPGIYLPEEFGMRLEYNIYLDPKPAICITGGIQEELRCLQV